MYGQDWLRTYTKKEKDMIADDKYRDHIKSTLLVLKKKMLRRTSDFFDSEDIRDYVEAVVFLKERGYSIGAEGTLERYEKLPEQDRRILDELDYPANLKKLISEGKLRAVIKTIVKSGLLQEEGGLEAPASGILFEEVVRCFDTWGMRGTVRQMDNITEVMQELLLQGIRSGNDGEISIYDMAMGKGFLLFDAGDKAGELCPEARVICCGQEKDPHNYIMAKTIARLKGREHDLVNADVIPEDHFVGKTFSIVITGFPVDTNWGAYANEVIEEYKTIPFGRFQPGLPGVYDGQVLYLLNGISKMSANGRMGIVMTHDALVDPRVKEMENIRKYILENDWIEAIVNTKAKPKVRKFSSIYILNNNKTAQRAGKIQIIDMADEKVEGKELVLQAYKEFGDQVYEDGEMIVESRICSTEEYENILCSKE